MFEKYQAYRKAKSECKAKITKAIKVWSGREEAIRDASFKDGAEFGYNKANEWQHGTSDAGKDLLCQTAPDEFEVGYYHPEDERFYTMDGTVINVIAWKKILPEVKKC